MESKKRKREEITQGPDEEMIATGVKKQRFYKDQD